MRCNTLSNWMIKETTKCEKGNNLRKNTQKQTKMKKENISKKKYLEKYRTAALKIERLKEEYNICQREMLSIKAINYDGMPHGSSGSDLSEIIARLEKRRERIGNAYAEKLETREEIKQAIELLGNEAEKQVLFLRYISLLAWDTIADRMNYTVQHVYRIHGYALNHFEIPKKSPRTSES